MLRTLPASLFALILLALLAFLSPRIVALAPLYTDKDLRGTVRIDVRKLSTELGWIVSDMPVVAATPRTFTFLYRPHHRHARGRPDCYVFYFVTNHVAPCASE